MRVTGELEAEKAEHASTRKRLKDISEEAQKLHEEIERNEDNIEDFRARVAGKDEEIKKLKSKLADKEERKLPSGELLRKIRKSRNLEK